MGENIFKQLENLVTEQRNPASMEIGTASVENILRIINNEDRKVANAVETQIPFIVQAVELIVEAFKKGGRLIYVGAGTSGRLGILDAVECPPTFGTSPELIQGLMAGGKKAMFRAQEGAEDKEQNGAEDIENIKVDGKDVVCGITASLRTPYVIGAIKKAKGLGAKTIFITTNPRSSLDYFEFEIIKNVIDVAICPEVGPEVIMGSTRMKSGTAQKLVLNMITTTAMIRLGKIYENMMVDLQATNKKLVERAKRIVMLATGVNYEEATRILNKTNGNVKTAIVMLKSNISYEEAVKRLKAVNGFVKQSCQG